MNCHQVIYWEPAPEAPSTQQRKVVAYYCAEHIAHVLSRFGAELEDDRFRIESVIEVGPVVALLDENGKARSF